MGHNFELASQSHSGNGGDRPSTESGFLIVTIKAGLIDPHHTDLAVAAKEAGLGELTGTLERFGLSATPLISSITQEQLAKIEEAAAGSKFEPAGTLSACWRVDVRQSAAQLEAIESTFRKLKEVDHVYRELALDDPATPDNNPFAYFQKYLDPAPTGIDARWAWTQKHGEGEGMHLIDLEQGWLLEHEDLPSLSIIFGDNRDGINGYTGDHGAAVLGEVVGLDNTKGIIGIIPSVASVRVASYWDAANNRQRAVADALVAAIASEPRPHVLLIEVETSGDGLPIEIEPCTFDAIRLAVCMGIIVIAAGGNGNHDLDAWTDSEGKRPLNRAGPDYKDSGAILVGAGTSALPHNRSLWPRANRTKGSNYGSRIDCYAWGDGIVSAGYGAGHERPRGYGSGNSSYVYDFAGTSGAAPIIAGAALLLQGLYYGRYGKLLLPEQMRGLLSAAHTGTVQGKEIAGNIGVMPDLRAIIENEFPKISERDEIGEKTFA